MNNPQHHNKKETVPNKEGEEEEEEEKTEDGLSPKHQKPTSPTITSLPPSSSSSPSHEFSFTLSLHPSTTKSPDKFKPPPPSFAIDLSPADDIFFHGHLLPLQLISRPPVSPRNSTTSSDNLNRPIRDLIGGQKMNSNFYYNSATTNKGNTSTASDTKERSKSKSFSIFGLVKWRKPFESGEKPGDVKKKKVRFNISRVLKRYMRLIQPLFTKGGEKDKCNFRRQPYSLSGNLNSKWKERGGRRGGEFSAPASMRTSPTNSGLLLATGKITSPNDSTMEELQSAIQAAIVHCKNSISVKEEKCK